MAIPLPNPYSQIFILLIPYSLLGNGLVLYFSEKDNSLVQEPPYFLFSPLKFLHEILRLSFFLLFLMLILPHIIYYPLIFSPQYIKKFYKIKVLSLFFIFSHYLLPVAVVHCSVAKSYLTLCNSMDCSTPGSWSLLKLMSTESVMPSNHLILCCALLLLPSIFPSIRIFSSESALRIR